MKIEAWAGRPKLSEYFFYPTWGILLTGYDENRRDVAVRFAPTYNQLRNVLRDAIGHEHCVDSKYCRKSFITEDFLLSFCPRKLLDDAKKYIEESGGMPAVYDVLTERARPCARDIRERNIELYFNRETIRDKYKEAQHVVSFTCV